jgi:ADP-heptose:LPS heptosyltransferase
MILFFLPNGLGDTIMAVPAIRRLVKARGVENITIVVASKTHTEMLQYFLGYPIRSMERFDGRPFAQSRLFLKMFRTRAEMIYAPLLSRKPGHLPFFLALATRTLAPASFTKRDFFSIIRAPHSLESFPGHQVDFMVWFVGQREKNMDPGPVQADEIRPWGLARAPHLQSAENRPFRIVIGLSCGSKERHKIPSPRIFAELINKLADRVALELVIPGLESDRALIDAFLAALAPGTRARTLIAHPLPSLLEAFQACDLGISGTTGQGHMMAASGLDMLLMSGVTEALESGPYTGRGAILRHALPCGPCYQEKFRFGCGKIPCMELLDLDKGADLAERLLKDPTFGRDWLTQAKKSHPIDPSRILEIQAKLAKERPQ